MKKIMIVGGVGLCVAVGLVFLLIKTNYVEPEIIEKIKDVVALPVPEKPVRVLSFGDVMFDRGVRNIIENRGRDPFEYIKRDIGLLDGYDVIVANLEGPIVEMPREDCQQKIYNFQFADDTPGRLKSIGINMVTIGNNHIFDCYQPGVDSTKSFLSQSNIDYVGDYNLEKSFVIKNINNKKVAFVGIDTTTDATRVSGLYSIIKKLDSENDYVVVYIHWGTEYELVENENQTVIAHKLVDNGADVVIGHHPHVMQPMRVYKNKPIFYSLGNFVFDQSAVNTTDGYGVGVDFYHEKMVFSMLPYKLKKFAPEFLFGEEKSKICSNMSMENCEMVFHTKN